MDEGDDDDKGKPHPDNAPSPQSPPPRTVPKIRLRWKNVSKGEDNARVETRIPLGDIANARSQIAEGDEAGTGKNGKNYDTKRKSTSDPETDNSRKKARANDGVRDEIDVKDKEATRLYTYFLGPDNDANFKLFETYRNSACKRVMFRS